MTVDLLWPIVYKTMIIHTLTYFIVGLIAFKLFNYTAVLSDASRNFRPVTHPLVRAGILFQPIRGFLFGIVFYLLRSVLFLQADGWLIIWVMLIVVGIISTFAPAPASIEGFIYTQVHRESGFLGLLEILLQSVLLSLITYYWVNHPEYSWLNWTLFVLFAITLILTALGLLASKAKSTT